VNAVLMALMPFIFDLIKEYIKSSDTTKDDKVLEVVQMGAKYLATSENNTVTQLNSDVLATAIMIGDDDDLS